MSGLALVPVPNVLTLNNINNEYVIWGPLVDGLSVVNGVLGPNPTFITDLVLTAQLYMDRDIFNPAATPGTLVTSFGTAGSLLLPHVGGGVYRAVMPSGLITPPGSNYVLVLDAPVSLSGYQGHWEKTTNVITRQN